MYARVSHTVMPFFFCLYVHEHTAAKASFVVVVLSTVVLLVAQLRWVDSRMLQLLIPNKSPIHCRICQQLNRVCQPLPKMLAVSNM